MKEYNSIRPSNTLPSRLTKTLPLLSRFEELGLSSEALKVLEGLGFEKPTPIQEQAIPLLLDNEPIDFIGLAQTGTGKTAAFSLPLLELIDPNKNHLQALIMAPTRELGQQTARQLELFAKKNKNFNVVCVYGGANISTQIKALKKPTQVVVATPGRLLDLMQRKALKLGQVEYVILDEADEMLNMGFKEDIDRILDSTPDKRVTWLFSATMPKDIRKIVKRYMTDPKEVSIISGQKTNKDISHQYVITKTTDKLLALRRFLDLQPDLRGVMFCRTRRETKEIADKLGDKGYNVEALHGDLSQGQRDAVMRRFKNRGMQLLIATDVAARGIDVNDLSHVLHHRLPDQLESYTHRSGRTARAGKKGVSIAFINSREGRKITALERQLDVKFEQIQVPRGEEVQKVRLENWAKDILRVEEDERSHAIQKELEDVIGFLSKEELMRLLISAELKKLGKEFGPDLNVTSGGQRAGESEDNDGHRFFINIGKMDDMNEKGLVRFLSEISNVKRKNFSNITIQKNCSYFTIPATQDKGFAASFAGIDFDGMELRVNRDAGRGGGKRPKRSGGGGYGRPKGRGPKFKGKKGRVSTSKGGKPKKRKKR